MRVALPVRGALRVVRGVGGGRRASVFYHLTPVERVDSILSRGLLPLSRRWREFVERYVPTTFRYEDVWLAEVLLEMGRPRYMPPRYECVFLFDEPQQVLGYATLEVRNVSPLGPFDMSWVSELGEIASYYFGRRYGDEWRGIVVELLRSSSTPREFLEKLYARYRDLFDEIYREWGWMVEKYWNGEMSSVPEREYLYPGTIPATKIRIANVFQ